MRISAAGRNVLIEHLDGNGVLWVKPRSARDPLERQRLSARLMALRGLLLHGLIKFDAREPGAHHSYITEKGRLALAEALADWADALDRAGDHLEGLIALARKRPETAREESSLSL